MKPNLLIVPLFVFLLYSCSTTGRENLKDSANNPGESVESSSPEMTAVQQALLEEEELKLRAEKIISRMTLDEKIGQLFILAMRHTSFGNPALQMDDFLAGYIRRYSPGGIILFSINFDTPEQTRNLILDMQETSSYPLFISTDEEGGKVSRLGKKDGMDVIALPPAADLAAMKSPALVEEASSVLAADLRDLGFNMNMAPVADISRNISPDIIGNRSFGRDPEQTGTFVASAVTGFQKNHIASVLKHFPGHGFVTGDTHTGMVKARGDKKEFETVDFIPFIKGIEAGTDCIMTAHIQAPSLTGGDEPASLSREIQTGILRQKLGFKGIILTDAMDMGAISQYWTPGEAALKAFLAGADIILMPENIPEAQESLKNAFLNGIISDDRLNASLIRIITTKIRQGLFETDPAYIERISSEIKQNNHSELLKNLNLTAK